MPLLTISNANIDFQARDLQWRFYTTKYILLITRQVKLIRKKKFAAAAFNLEHKIFIVHIVILNIDSSDEIYPSKKAQIAHLKANEAFFKVLSKYADFADVFLLKLIAELLNYIRINNHTIKLIND